MNTNTDYGIVGSCNLNPITTDMQNIDKSTDAVKSSGNKKVVENIKKQIDNIIEDDKLDAKTKKQRIKDLKEDLKEAEDAEKQRRAEEQKEAQEKVATKKDQNNNKSYQSSDGDKLTISEQASNLIKNETILKQTKMDESAKMELENTKEILKNQIDIDKKRGVDTSKKEERLEKLEQRDVRISNLKEKMSENNSVKQKKNDAQKEVSNNVLNYADAEEITAKFISD